MHTYYYKIVKQLKSYKIVIVAPTCFGLHKPSSGSISWTNKGLNTINMHSATTKIILL